MNIAILIGISTYKNANHLPACKADVEQMRKLLSATNKYDDIQCLIDNTAAAQIKDSLRAFFTNHSKNSIDEAFIYFSGHGVFHQDDALLCCSDFDLSRPSTTSISNAELDDLLRSVAPEVAVKVIDACQSGSPYIKDADAGFEKAFRSSRLNSFICMASSRLDQSSYASAEASDFTANWIEAALQRTDGTVLYRDIQAALADAFVSTPEQTPFFVNQGTGLEAFASVTDEMKQLADKRVRSTPSQEGKDTTVDLLLREIQRLDGNFVSQEDAHKSIETVAKMLDSTAIADPWAGRFYSKRISLGTKLSSLPRVREVAKFADEQGWQKNYFVRIPTEEYKVRVPKSDPYAYYDLAKSIAAWSSLRSYSVASATKNALTDKTNESEYILETRNRPASLESTQSLPFEVAEIHYEAPGHPSLRSFVSYIGIVHSLTEVMVLSSTVRLAQKGWSERAPEISEIQWKFQSYRWADIVITPDFIVSEVLTNAEAIIHTYLQALIPKQDLPVPETQPELSTEVDSQAPVLN